MSSIAEVGIPIGPASVGREIEQVPQRVDRLAVPGVLAGIGRLEQKLGTPEVTNGVGIATEDVQHRQLLGAVVALAVVVAVVRVVRRRQESQPPPSATLRMGESARQ